MPRDRTRQRLNKKTNGKINQGDDVYYKPTREFFTVCGVNYNTNPPTLIPWDSMPRTVKNVEDCELIHVGNPSREHIREYDAALREMGCAQYGSGTKI